MNDLITHLKGTRKSGYLLIGFSLLLPLGYTIGNVVGHTFNMMTFAQVLVMAVAGGTGLGIILMTADYLNTQKVKNRLLKINFKELGDGNLQLIDFYTGWMRRVELEGTFNNRKIWISHRFEKGWWGQIPYLTIYLEPYDDEIAEVRLGASLTPDKINDLIVRYLQINTPRTL